MRFHCPSKCQTELFITTVWHTRAVTYITYNIICVRVCKYLFIWASNDFLHNFLPIILWYAPRKLCSAPLWKLDDIPISFIPHPLLLTWYMLVLKVIEKTADKRCLNICEKYYSKIPMRDTYRCIICNWVVTFFQMQMLFDVEENCERIKYNPQILMKINFTRNFNCNF